MRLGWIFQTKQSPRGGTGIGPIDIFYLDLWKPFISAHPLKYIDHISNIIHIKKFMHFSLKKRRNMYASRINGILLQNMQAKFWIFVCFVAGHIVSFFSFRFFLANYRSMQCAPSIL